MATCQQGRGYSPRYQSEVLAIISLNDEVAQVTKKREAAQEKLRRMAKAYIDGIFPDPEYHRQKKLIEMELKSLVKLGVKQSQIIWTDSMLQLVNGIVKHLSNGYCLVIQVLKLVDIIQLRILKFQYLKRRNS